MLWGHAAELIYLRIAYVIRRLDTAYWYREGLVCRPFSNDFIAFSLYCVVILISALLSLVYIYHSEIKITSQVKQLHVFDAG